MTIPTGPIGLDNIQTEFGGTAPIGIDEYYQNGGTGYVTSTNYTPAGVIPATGAISIGNFAGVSKITDFVFNDVVASNLTTGYSLVARATTAGWNGTAKLIATVTINAGVTITAPDAGWTAAFSTLNLSPYPVGSTLTVINNGVIAGLGGTGGVGGNISGTTFTNGANGGPGYLGLYVSLPTDFYNYGTIGGGGGGGGGGGASRHTLDTKIYYGGSGGGGGGGRANGALGVAGTATGGLGYYGTAFPGGAGTLAAAGAGGNRYVISGVIGTGFGGAGGNLGQPGFAGTLPDLGYVNGGYSNPGAGGAAGGAIVGGANITWYAFGSRLGTIDNPGISMVPSFVVNGNNYDGFALRFGVAIINFTFGSEGLTSYNGTGTTTGSNPAWYSPAPTTNIGASYWVRLTEIGGNLGGIVSGTLPINGTWVSLATAKTLTLSSGSDADAMRSYTIDFATSSGGPVVSSSNLTLEAINSQF